jgi:poly(3-hydroxybutyrate) depolymerase
VTILPNNFEPAATIDLMKVTTISGVLLPIIAATAALPTAGFSSTCNKPIPDGIEPGKSKNLTLTSKSGVSPRKYRLHLPKTYDGSTNLPLILSFHGRGKDAKFQEKLSQFSNSSYGFDGIAVYPEGVPFRKVRITSNSVFSIGR